MSNKPASGSGSRHTIPVIDIAPFRSGDPAGSKAVVRAVCDACEGIGFFVITGHGVPTELVDRVFGNGSEFFDLPMEEKLKVRKPPGPDSKGFSPQGLKTVGKDRDPTLKPSLHESYAIGPLDATDDPYYHCEEAGFSFAPNHWPVNPPGMKQAMIDYYREMERLSRDILRIFAQALDVPEAYFLDKINRHTSILRVIHYPELKSAPQPGEERSAAHTDTTAITILRIDDAPGGLQVDTPSGEVIDVRRIPDSFVINIGDIMMRWTNDRFVSTMHRVVNPPPDAGRTARRLSIPFFLLPNYDAEIVCVPSCTGSGAKYPPTTSGKLLAHRLTVTFSVKQPAAA